MVKACLNGDQSAWNAIVHKYKRLIYSIPVKQGFAPEDTNDIFQSVCLELLRELPKIREPKALAGWLIKVTSHKCFHWKRRESRYVLPDNDEAIATQGGATSERPLDLDELLDQVEREQLLRETMAKLTERCKKLVTMLFFEFPPVPYEDVAKKLGLARGSIGFIRRRCLDRLRRQLEDLGFVRGHG